MWDPCCSSRGISFPVETLWLQNDDDGDAFFNYMVAKEEDMNSTIKFVI